MEATPLRSFRLLANRPNLGAFKCALAHVLASGLILTAAGQSDSKGESESSLEVMASDLEKLDLLKRGLAPEKSNPLDASVQFTTPKLQDESATSSVVTSLGSLSSEKQREESWREENWLLAGMQESHGQDPAGAITADEEELKPKSGSADHWLLLAAEAGGEHDHIEKADSAVFAEELAGQVVNPLEGFMTGWLDASLAVTEFSTDRERSGLAGVENITDRDFGTELFDLSAQPGFSTAGIDLGPALGESRTNPYTEGLGDLPGLTGLSIEGLDMAPSNDRRSPIEDLAPSTAAPSAITPNPTVKPTREPWRPPERDEDKYFRRLNQF